VIIENTYVAVVNVDSQRKGQNFSLITCSCNVSQPVISELEKKGKVNLCIILKAMKISTIFESNLKLTQQSRNISKDSSE